MFKYKYNFHDLYCDMALEKNVWKESLKHVLFPNVNHTLYCFFVFSLLSRDAHILLE